MLLWCRKYTLYRYGSTSINTIIIQMEMLSGISNIQQKGHFHRKSKFHFDDLFGFRKRFLQFSRVPFFRFVLTLVWETYVAVSKYNEPFCHCTFILFNNSSLSCEFGKITHRERECVYTNIPFGLLCWD